MITEKNGLYMAIAMIFCICISPAAIMADETKAFASVLGEAPKVVSVEFSGDNVENNQVSLTPGIGITTPVKVSASIYCINGPNGIKTVTLDITPDMYGYTETIEMKEESRDPDENTITFVTTLDVMYNTTPGKYLNTVTAYHVDSNVKPGTGTKMLEVLETLAIHDLENIKFGEMLPGGDTSTQWTKIENIGNVNLTINPKPEDMYSGLNVIESKYITSKWDEDKVIEVDAGAKIDSTLEVILGTSHGDYTGIVAFLVSRP